MQHVLRLHRAYHYLSNALGIDLNYMKIYSIIDKPVIRLKTYCQYD